MTCPMYHEIPVDAYLPLIKRMEGTTDAKIAIEDKYEQIYKPLGITRDEMMIIMGRMMSVDVVVGTEKLHYIDE